jgi:benzodiazapine receptor
VSSTASNGSRGGIFPLLGFILAALAVGALGGWVTSTSVGSWYQTLRKPAFNPPNAVFGPVWTTLYLLMAVAAWRVWRRRSTEGASRLALSLWWLQLALNLAWSCLFFGLRNPAAALAEILLLFAAVAGTLASFWRRDRAAGALLVPYLGWVSFAAVLNFEIWRLNSPP